MTPSAVGAEASGSEHGEGGSSALFGRGLLYVVVLSLQLLVSSLISPFLTHIMGPAEFGALSSALAIYQVLSVAALLGIDEAVILQRAESRDGRSARGLVTIAVIISFVVTGLALVTIPLWAGPLGFSGYPLLIVAVILWTGPSAAVTVMLALLVAEDRIKPFALVGIIAAIGGSIVGLVLLLTVDRSATVYAWGGVGTQFVAMIIAFVIVRPNLQGFREFDITRRAIRLGVPLALGGLAYFVLNAGDRIIIQRELGATEVGRYQVAYVIGSAVILLLNFTNGAWTAHFASLVNDRARYALAMKSRNQLYRLLVPIVLAVTLIAPLALRILAPASFRPAGLSVVVLIVALTAFPVAASGAAQRLLVIGRRGKTVGVIAGVAALMNIALNLLLVEPMGILGAAVATLVSYSLMAFLQLRFLPDRASWKGAPRHLIVMIFVTVGLAAASLVFPQTVPWNIGRAVLAFACLPWFLLRLRDARNGARDELPEEREERTAAALHRAEAEADVAADSAASQAPDAHEDIEVVDAPDDLQIVAALFTEAEQSAQAAAAHAEAPSVDPTAPYDPAEIFYPAESRAMTSTSPTAEGPGPRRVVSIDLDQPAPELVADYRYATAMVVGYRGTVPLGAIDIELTDDPKDAAEKIAPLYALVLPPLAAGDVDVPDAMLPSISVVVSSIVRRPDDLALLLDAFERLDYPSVEFVLVDNRVTLPADDRLPELIAGRPNIRTVRETRPGAASGRNAGIAATKYDVIAFTDDDVRVDENWLRVIGQRFARADRIDALTGLILPAELETPAQIWFEGYYGGFAGERTFVPLTLEGVSSLPKTLRGSKISVQDPAGVEIRQFPVYGVGAYGAGANMAFRRSALERVHGFNPALGTGTPALGGEDLETIVKILWTGGRMAFEPRAVVHHRHRRLLPELEKQLHGYGFGFTAMLTSLIMDDPRHLVSLGWQVPSAAGRLAARAAGRILGRSATDETEQETTVDLSGGYPKSLVSTELRGFPGGPLGYLRSRRSWRSIQRTHATASPAAAPDSKS